MNSRFHMSLAALALCGALNHAATAAETQTAPTLAAPLDAPAAATAKSTRIKVQNVPASLIAWWLDPKNNARSAHLASNRFEFKRETADSPSNRFALPEGVERIAPDGSQKSLLVFGTPAGTAKLAAIISFLDQPLRRVEVQLQWVQINREDVAKIGIEVPQLDKKGLQINFVKNNYQTILSQLLKENRAKILTEWRLLSFNNGLAKGQFSGAVPVAQNQGGAAQIEFENSIAVTPTINGDDTITVLLSTHSILKLLAQNAETMAPKGEPKGFESIINARDGATVALSGANSLFLTTPPVQPEEAATDLLIFVTPRIIRPVADKKIDATPN